MIKTQTLDSGIRVVTEKIPHVKSVSVGVWIMAGAVDESAAVSGISHFMEHMSFKGTKTRTAKKIAEDVDMIGGQINAFTGKEATCYYIKTLTENLAKAVDILADMLQNSLFEETELLKERLVILEEMKMIEDTPDELAQDLLIENIFKEQPLGKSIIGEKESLLSIGRNDFLDYHEQNYACDRIVISIAGNFDEFEMIKRIEADFTKFISTSEKRTKTESTYVRTDESRNKDIEQTHICLGKKGISLDDDKYYALSVLNSIFGGGMSSRLFQNIREQKGLAYSVFSMSSSFVDDGYFMIYAGVSEENKNKALEGIRDELEYLKINGITSDELTMAKQQIKGNYIFGLENTASRMFANGKSKLLLDRIYTPEDVIREIDLVDENNIGDCIELISGFDEYSSVIIGKERP